MKNTENMLSILSKQIKSKHLSVDELAEQCDMSRAKFYRYVKEPKRFTGEQFSKLCEVLEFDEQQKRKLYDLRNLNNDETYYQASNEEQTKIITEIIFSKPIADDFDESMVLELYKESNDFDGATSISKYQARHLASLLAGKTDDRKGEKFKYTVVMYNCVNDRITKALAVNFGRLRDALASKGIEVSIKIMQFIAHYEKSATKDLDIVRCSIPLSAVTYDYKCNVSSDSNAQWGYATDSIIIKCERGNEKPVCYLMNLTPRGRAYIVQIDSGYQYEYFIASTKEILFATSLPHNSLNVSIQAMNEALAVSKKVLIHYNFAYDTIKTEYFKNLFENLDDEQKRIIAEALNPLESILSPKETLDSMLSGINERYRQNEKMENMAILSATGLAEFAATHYYSEFAHLKCRNGIDMEQLKFTKEETVKILTELKDRLGNNGPRGRQKIFILSRVYKDECSSVVSFRDAGFWSLSSSGPFYTQPLTDTNTTVGRTIYTYISDRLIGNRGMADSPVMSDDEAAEYLQGLINSVE